jgi:DHA1 family multidrug resistance protein-like MFS transporter
MDWRHVMTLNLHPPGDFIRRNLLAIYIGAFFAALGFSFITPLVPLLTLELLDGELARVAIWTGVAIGIAPLLTALTGPWWGAFGDRVGQKKMLQRALISIGVAMGLMSLIDHPWQLVGLRGVIGVLGGIQVASLAAITTTSSKQTLGRNIGFLQAAQTLGFVVGPLLGGGLALAAGIRPTFVISAALFAIGLGLVTWLYRDLPRRMLDAKEARTAETHARSGGLAGSLTLWAMLAVLFTASFLDSSFIVVLPLYLPTLGAPTESLALLAGVGLSGGALATAVAAAMVGRITTRFRAGALMLVMLGASAVVLLATAAATSWWQLVGLRALLGLTAGGLPPVAYAAAAGLAPTRSGAMVGLASSAGLLGWAIAPLLVGFLVGTDPRAVFGLDLLLVVVSATALSLSGRGLTLRAMPRAAWAGLTVFARSEPRSRVPRVSF